MITGLQPAELPHSEIAGSKVVCTYPTLIAAYHVLHRLLEPRHPPFALSFFFYNVKLQRNIYIVLHCELNCLLYFAREQHN